MKKTVALTLAASTLFLAGFCTQHSGKWQYEMIKASSGETLNTPTAQAEHLVVVGFTTLPDGNYMFLVKHKPIQ